MHTCMHAFMYIKEAPDCLTVIQKYSTFQPNKNFTLIK